jgi:hypothetical protein
MGRISIFSDYVVLNIYHIYETEKIDTRNARKINVGYTLIAIPHHNPFLIPRFLSSFLPR